MDRPTALSDADVLELGNKLTAYAARQGLAPPPLRMVSGVIALDPERLQRWAKSIAERPAVKRGRMVNRFWGEPYEQLTERHSANDFETNTEDKRAD